MTLIKNLKFTIRSNQISAFLHTYVLNYDNQGVEIEKIQPLIKLEFLLSNINSKSCNIKIDEFINTGDIILIIGYRTLNKSNILKLGTNENLDENFSIASCFLKEVILEKMKNENQFSLIAGPFKTTTH